MEQSRWDQEQLFLNGDEYFAEMERHIRAAKKSLDVETYIFHDDRFGRHFVDLLVETAARGVNVRLTVDGVGASGWRSAFGEQLTKAGVAFKVYHELPWMRIGKTPASAGGRPGLVGLMRFINSRLHRKMFLIDGEEAWCGSFNISGKHLQSVSGSKAWKDIGIRVQGAGLEQLRWAFDKIWLSRRANYAQTITNWYRRRTVRKSSSLVRLNNTRRLRRKYYAELLTQLRRAEKHIYIISAYFIPTPSVLRALTSQAKKGIDVRLLLPSYSDIFFVPWINLALYEKLLRSGIRVFEYTPSMLHAKAICVDDWAVVGSSNLNHRSIIHDLEVDIVITDATVREQLIFGFMNDLKQSHEVKLAELGGRSTLLRLMGKALLFLRYFF